jgi:hypothetical protein
MLQQFTGDGGVTGGDSWLRECVTSLTDMVIPLHDLQSTVRISRRNAMVVMIRIGVTVMIPRIVDQSRRTLTTPHRRMPLLQLSVLNLTATMDLTGFTILRGMAVVERRKYVQVCPQHGEKAVSHACSWVIPVWRARFAVKVVWVHYV